MLPRPCGQFAGIFAPFFPGRKMHYRNKWYADLGEAPLLLRSAFTGNTFLSTVETSS
jgi:hypothetical protein